MKSTPSTSISLSLLYLIGIILVIVHSVIIVALIHNPTEFISATALATTTFLGMLMMAMVISLVELWTPNVVHPAGTALSNTARMLIFNTSITILLIGVSIYVLIIT